MKSLLKLYSIFLTKQNPLYLVPGELARDLLTLKSINTSLAYSAFCELMHCDVHKKIFIILSPLHFFDIDEWQLGIFS